jgi:general secretion pathway protein H
MYRTRGLSLIELLVVVAIMAILAGAALLAVNAAGPQRQVERELRRLAGRIERACERAQLSGLEAGLHLHRAGYAFSRAGFEGWVPEVAQELRPSALVQGLELSATRDGVEMELPESEAEAPQIVCLPSGELTAVVVTIGTPSRDVRGDLRGEPDGSLVVVVGGAP